MGAVKLRPRADHAERGGRESDQPWVLFWACTMYGAGSTIRTLCCLLVYFLSLLVSS